jgi:DNA-binding CsgD family transcriptional regulator
MSQLNRKPSLPSTTALPRPRHLRSVADVVLLKSTFLDVGGRLELPGERDVDDSTCDRFRSVVAAQDQQVSGSADESAELLHTELLAGVWVLTGRFESGGRRYAIASRVARDLAAGLLSARARRALALAIRGVANKVIAIELGVSQPTVTRLLSSALETLRVANLAEAFVLSRARPIWLSADEQTMCALQLDEPASTGLDNLTSAERDIVQQLAAGASRAAVARTRGTSLYTVNSQIASIFAKLRVGSKRELLKRMMSGRSELANGVCSPCERAASSNGPAVGHRQVAAEPALHVP